MEIIPAIYILGGRCVALYKGSYEQKETYYKSPLEMARAFERDGADRLYLVDLDGKQNNTFMQRDLIGQIARTVKIPILIEAGFSSLTDLQEAFSRGVSVAVMRPASIGLLQEAVEKFSADHIYALIQAHDSVIIEQQKDAKTIRAEQEARRAKLGLLHRHSELPDVAPGSEIDIVDFAEKLVPLGIKNIVYKDETSEGTLIHPNYDEVDRLKMTIGEEMQIFVSGGISEDKHLLLLKKIGAAGAIIGKAFYEKILSVAHAKRIAE